MECEKWDLLSFHSPLPPQFVRRLLFQLVGMIRLQLLADLDVPCAKWAEEGRAGGDRVRVCTARYPWWLLKDTGGGSRGAGDMTALEGGEVNAADGGRPQMLPASSVLSGSGERCCMDSPLSLSRRSHGTAQADAPYPHAPSELRNQAVPRRRPPPLSRLPRPRPRLHRLCWIPSSRGTSRWTFLT